MEFRKLGKSDIEVSVLAFGAWAIGGWFWGGADSKDAIDAIETAIDNGMTTIDTAPVYGFGHSEEIVGKAIKGKRDRIQLLTKYGLSWDDNKGLFYFDTRDNNGRDLKIYKHASRKKILSECEKSLKRLGTNYLDLYQIHWPDPTTPVSETMEAMEILIQQGKIRAGGVCNYGLELTREASGRFPLASNQVPYSMVNRKIENDVVPFCIEKNIGILAYSPLQRGLLTGKIKPGHTFNEGDNRPSSFYFKEPNHSNILNFLSAIRHIADSRGITLAQLVLNWTIRQPGITCTLAGARNPEQVLDNIGAVSFDLTPGEIEEIDKALQDLKIQIIR